MTWYIIYATNATPVTSNFHKSTFKMSPSSTLPFFYTYVHLWTLATYFASLITHSDSLQKALMHKIYKIKFTNLRKSLAVFAHKSQVFSAAQLQAGISSAVHRRELLPRCLSACVTLNTFLAQILKLFHLSFDSTWEEWERRRAHTHTFRGNFV